jgi:hypothetical protein
VLYRNTVTVSVSCSSVQRQITNLQGATLYKNPLFTFHSHDKDDVIELYSLSNSCAVIEWIRHVDHKRWCAFRHNKDLYNIEYAHIFTKILSQKLGIDMRV